MPIDRKRARAIISIVILSVPLYLSAQQEAAEVGPVRQGALPKSEAGSVIEAVGTEPTGTASSWNSSTRWNARLKMTSAHSSATGWETIATPAGGHRFNATFSVEASMPIYLYRLAESRLPDPPRDAILVNQRGELGDLLLFGHARFKPRAFHYQLTGGVTCPTGDEPYGLSTGRVTFDLTNHVQRSFGRVTATMTAGAGDSTALANRLVIKTPTSLGPLAHFRTGLAIQLSRHFTFEADGAEQMPIGDQKIYATRIEQTKLTRVVTGTAVAERSGLNALFDAIIDRHTIFSSYYSRSLRPGGDTISVGLIYSLRSYLPGRDIARDDLFR